MSISLQIGLDAIVSYRRLAYTPWHAIAEFVDNATQSYFDNKEELEDYITSQEDFPLQVIIEYQPENDLFRVTDNAMGMSYSELEHALHIAQPPINSSGRSKYGMGLKTAACWIGNEWSVRTKKLGETKEHFIIVDVIEIAKGNNNLPYECKDGLPIDTHYTIVEIRKHNRSFKGRTLYKIKQYLSSMYRQDFRDEILYLEWRGESLSWVEVDDRLLENYEGQKYKKSFEFSIGEDDKNRKKVFGWVGILRDGSRSNAGFSILHANRVIKGWPDSWRPASLYGTDQGSNDLVNQRLVGEIHLDDFDVSHTKDDIIWYGTQDEEVEQKLQETCGDYRRIAQEYRKSQRDERGPSEIETQTAVTELQKELISPEMADVIKMDPMLPEVLVEQVVKSVRELVTKVHKERFEAQINGLRIRGYIETDMSPQDPYVTIDSAKSNEVIIIVNAAHPHWNQLLGSRGVLNYLRHCTYDGIAEWQARHKTARIDPDTIKLLKDKLLRLAIDIERHTTFDSLDHDLIPDVST